MLIQVNLTGMIFSLLSQMIKNLLTKRVLKETLKQSLNRSCSVLIQEEWEGLLSMSALLTSTAVHTAVIVLLQVAVTFWTFFFCLFFN